MFKIKEIEEIKGVFKLPKKSYYFGKIRYGTPYFYPWNFNSNILTIRKNRPKYLRCKHFKLFGYEISYGSPIWFSFVELGWKDKYDSPRHEWNPSFHIYFFKWQFSIFWCCPDVENGSNESYWQQVLWYLKYCDKDIVKSKDTWGWVDYKTKESTWNDNYLLVNIPLQRKVMVEKLNA